jgi:uncharacterized cupin superfamily protein
MKVFNLLDGELAYDESDLGKYHARFAKAGAEIGAERLAATAIVLEQGQAVCPYHYELAEEEWLLVLEGTPAVRTPAGEETLSAGDVICFPRGPEGAHQILNATADPARFLIVSERAECAASVYEDSDKIGIYAPGTRHLFRRSDERDYYDGEAT